MLLTFLLLLTEQRHHLIFFFFNDTATTEIYTLSLHDALPISHREGLRKQRRAARARPRGAQPASPGFHTGCTLARCWRRLGTSRVRTGTDDPWAVRRNRKSTRLNSSHLVISYAVFCLKKKTDMDLAAQGLGAKEWNNSLKTKLSLLPKKLFRISMSRNFGMKMLTMTKLSTECLIQLTKLGYDATPFNQILKQNAKREMRLRLGKVTVADVLAAQPVTTNLLKFMRASIKMIGVSNLQSFIASMTQKLTLSDISDESKNYLDKAGITTACLRIHSKWTAGGK